VYAEFEVVYLSLFLCLSLSSVSIKPSSRENSQLPRCKIISANSAVLCATMYWKWLLAVKGGQEGQTGRETEIERGRERERERA
jgi:hypothetical protein